jgi:hypothetical protein
MSIIWRHFVVPSIEDLLDRALALGDVLAQRSPLIAFLLNVGPGVSVLLTVTLPLPCYIRLGIEEKKRGTSASTY